jgi:hypothetical protein
MSASQLGRISQSRLLFPRRTGAVNARMVVFCAIVLLLIAWPFYSYLTARMNHGIRDRGDYKEVDLAQLGDFEFDQGTGTIANVPARFRALDGQKVLIRGKVFNPQPSEDGMVSFQIVSANADNRRPPHVQERVFGTVPASQFKQDLSANSYKALGTMHIVLKQGRYGEGETGVVEIFHIQAQSVQPD